MYCKEDTTDITYTMHNVCMLLLPASVECLTPWQPHLSGQEVTSSNDNVTTGPCWSWQLSWAPGKLFTFQM